VSQIKKVVLIFFGCRRPYLVTCKLTISYKSVVLRITSCERMMQHLHIRNKGKRRFFVVIIEYNSYYRNSIWGVYSRVYNIQAFGSWGWTQQLMKCMKFVYKNVHQFSISLFTIVLTVKSVCMWVVFVYKYLQYHTHGTPQKNPRSK